MRLNTNQRKNMWGCVWKYCYVKMMYCAAQWRTKFLLTYCVTTFGVKIFDAMCKQPLTFKISVAISVINFNLQLLLCHHICPIYPLLNYLFICHYNKISPLNYYTKSVFKIDVKLMNVKDSNYHKFSFLFSRLSRHSRNDFRGIRIPDDFPEKVWIQCDWI